MGTTQDITINLKVKHKIFERKTQDEDEMDSDKNIVNVVFRYFD